MDNDKGSKINVKIGSPPENSPSTFSPMSTEIKPSGSDSQSSSIFSDQASNTTSTSQVGDSNTNSTIPNIPLATPPASSGLSTGTVSGPQLPGAVAPLGGSNNKKVGGKQKILLLSVVGTFLLLGGVTSAAYFGYVVPNKPENIWSTAMSNTSTGFDKLISYNEEQKGKTSIKAEGDYSMDFEGNNISGSFNMDTDQSTVKMKGDMAFSGARVNAEIMAETPEDSSFPDTYIKFDGVKQFDKLLSDNDGQPGILNQVDGKWIYVDRSLYDQMIGSEIELDTTSQQRLSIDDFKKMVDITGSTSKKYVFSTEKTTAIFDANEFIGKEDMDGRQQYHYKVSVNKENLKKYVAELTQEIKSSDAFKKLGASESSMNLDSLNKEIDGIDDSYRADAWIDAKTKLIRIVRFTDGKNSKNYVDIGLKYDGGDKFPFYIGAFEDSDDIKSSFAMNVSLDTKKDTIELDLKGDSEEKGSTGSSAKTNMSLKGNISFGNDEVTFEKPTDVIPMIEILSDLSSDSSSPGLQSNATNLDQATNLLGASTIKNLPAPNTTPSEQLNPEVIKQLTSRLVQPF